MPKSTEEISWKVYPDEIYNDNYSIWYSQEEIEQLRKEILEICDNDMLFIDKIKYLKNKLK